MRKWICVGVLGGLLEFGIIYQVAFSDTDSPAPETLRAGESNGPKTPRQAKQSARSSRRSPRHIAAAAGSGDAAAPATTASPAAKTATKATTSPSKAASAGTPATAAGTGTSGSPAPGDPLADTLKAAVSAVATLPMSLGLPAPAVEGGLVPGLPVTIPGLLETPAGAEELAKVLPLPTPAPAPSPKPVDVASLPVEEMIRHVFGAEGDKAVQVAFCESTLRTQAKKGQFLGLFQMGANERADYGHGPDALAQVLAAHKLFLDRGWQPWECA